MLMSENQEIATGKQSDPEIKAFFGVYEDARLQKFIQEKGEQMAAISHRKNLDFQFQIVDSPVVNAFAVPGGYVYFTRGIMAHFNNEAEFAGVLGHEIGHITARHSAKQYSRAMLAQVGLIAGTVISDDFARYADIAQTGVSLLFLKFGRDAESQSDNLGVQYSTAIGYDAKEMATFFQTLDRLQKKSGAEVPDFLSTHPNPGDRERKVSKAAESAQKKTPKANLKVGRDSYLKMIDGLIYGEDPKQGFAEGGVFYHPVLKFQFPIPRQWNLENTPQQVQMAASDGGAVLIMTIAGGNNLEQAANSVIQKYQLNIVESGKRTINGMPAVEMVADQQQEGQAIRTYVTLIDYSGSIYLFIGASQRQQFDAYAPILQSTIRNFDVLTDRDKLNRQPERIRIKTIPRNESFAQAMRDFSVSEKRIQETAILNGMSLEEPLEKGTLIKIIEQ
ncbi:peptidase M48 [Pseudochryseolinea flava]|uniref:Peptidase M48 n=2 Tax=Pseudochryseolinea flava TaxID=2059302 RepID=A0A364Y394_9BACT|nr:peptidase M48 [Pseudochryseolinea flava]